MIPSCASGYYIRKVVNFPTSMTMTDLLKNDIGLIDSEVSHGSAAILYPGCRTRAKS